MKKSNVWTFLWRKFLAPVGLSIILAYGFINLPKVVPFLETWLGILAEPTPDWYMNTYYNTVNGMTLEANKKFPDIVMLDLKETITRKDLGDLLHVIADSSPKVVGIDCTFSTSDSYASKQTDSLIQTIAHLNAPFPIVFAVVLNEPSAIPDSLIHYKGFVDALEFHEYNAYKGEYPHLPFEMVRLAGYDIGQIDTSAFVVNWRIKDFTSVDIYSDFMTYASSIQDSIKDKIVIIGGLNNRLDMHYVPFNITPNDARVSGSRILAYTTSSLITAACKEEYCNIESFHYYSRCPLWVNSLLTILFTIVYLCIYILIVNAQKKSRWYELFKPVLLFCMLVSMITFSMMITKNFFYIPYIGFFIVLTVFLGFSYDIFNPYIPTLEIEKSRRSGKKHSNSKNLRINKTKIIHNQQN